MTCRLVRVLVACGVFAVVVGCASSSHKSVRTYEYSNEPRGERSAQPAERVDDSGDWEMTQPGQMVVTPDK